MYVGNHDFSLRTRASMISGVVVWRLGRGNHRAGEQPLATSSEALLLRWVRACGGVQMLCTSSCQHETAKEKLVGGPVEAAASHIFSQVCGVPLTYNLRCVSDSTFVGENRAWQTRALLISLLPILLAASQAAALPPFKGLFQPFQ